MTSSELCPEIWLQFQRTDHSFTVTPTGAHGSSISAMPISLGSWDELATKLEQAGFSPNSVNVLKERLEDHAVAIVGPVSMTIDQLAVLGIRQAA